MDNRFVPPGMVEAIIGDVKTQWVGVYSAAMTADGALSLASMAAADATISMLF